MVLRHEGPYIVVDDESCLVHSLIGTTAKVSDMSQYVEIQGPE